MPPDELARTTKIPVRIVDGQPQPFYGSSWPKLKNGAVGELTLPAHAILDPEAAVVLSAPLGTEILARETILLAAISPRRGRSGILWKGEQLAVDAPFDAYVELRTEEALRIQLRGTKRGRLERCRCSIPELKEQRDSVNEAYTRISEIFEPDRRSHTGNAFQKVMYSRIDPSGRVVWSPLEELRVNLEAVLEARFRHTKKKTE